jgi:hypothetical protein
VSGTCLLVVPTCRQYLAPHATGTGQRSDAAMRAGAPASIHRSWLLVMSGAFCWVPRAWSLGFKWVVVHQSHRIASISLPVVHGQCLLWWRLLVQLHVDRVASSFYWRVHRGTPRPQRLHLLERPSSAKLEIENAEEEILAAMALTEMAGGSGCPAPFKPEAFRSSLRKERLEQHGLVISDSSAAGDGKDACCTPAKPSAPPWEGAYSSACHPLRCLCRSPASVCWLRKQPHARRLCHKLLGACDIQC